MAKKYINSDKQEIMNLIVQSRVAIDFLDEVLKIKNDENIKGILRNMGLENGFSFWGVIIGHLYLTIVLIQENKSKSIGVDQNLFEIKTSRRNPDILRALRNSISHSKWRFEDGYFYFHDMNPRDKEDTLDAIITLENMKNLIERIVADWLS